MSWFKRSEKEKNAGFVEASKKDDELTDEFTKVRNSMMNATTNGKDSYEKFVTDSKLNVDPRKVKDDYFINVSVAKGPAILTIQIKKREREIQLDYPSGGKKSEKLSFSDVGAAKNKVFAFLSAFRL